MSHFPLHFPPYLPFFLAPPLEFTPVSAAVCRLFFRCPRLGPPITDPGSAAVYGGGGSRTMTAGEAFALPGAMRGIGGPGTTTGTCGATRGGAVGRAEGVVREVGAPADRDGVGPDAAALPAAAR